MTLIVGLGNPGDKYRGTRHNIGFDVIDVVAARRGLEFESCPVEALVARERGPGARVMLAKPLTFMNLSGRAVQGLRHYYRIELESLLVVADDVHLPLGTLRGRRQGSDGGHNGFGSIIEAVGSSRFARLRVGVGRGDERWTLANHVLARFDRSERDVVARVTDRAADAVDMFVEHGLDTMMNRFNRQDAEESRGAEASPR